MTTRSDLSGAWLQGLKSGKDGASRSSNPYTDKDSEMAKNWGQGWKEGTDEN